MSGRRAPSTRALFDRALAGSFLPILGAIENAPNLSKAVELYEGCPAALRKNDKKHDLDRSLLSAMGKEAELLEKGFGDAGLLVTWMVKLGRPAPLPGRRQRGQGQRPHVV